MYADIIINITHEKLDRVFQYLIPEELTHSLEIGMEVWVPFGRSNKETKGYIVGFSEDTSYDVGKMKQILRISDDCMGIEARLVTLAAWMKEHYGGTMIQALKTVLPMKHKEQEKQQRVLKLLLSKEEGEQYLKEYLRKSQKARARLMELLLEHDEIEYEQIPKEQKITLSVVRALEEQGVLEIVSQRVYRNPIKEQKITPKLLEYTEEQKKAIDIFINDYEKKKYQTYLLYGVTGSGKTEVYIEMMRKVISEGRQVIVLIPEIALTFQTVQRFYHAFGERISIMNSRLSAGEKYDQMMRAKEGKIDVMIGPRSALFTPFPNLGLIIIDEEHESAYKSEPIPRYHARETAEKRASLERASLVLGSATPSLEAFSRCKDGTYICLELSKRVNGKELAKTHVVDMREELKKGNKSIFSDLLKTYMQERLEKKEQAMLFINRRGYAGFISCRSCGYVVKCPHCDISLAAHNNGKLMCHYCGYEEIAAKECPICGSKHIGGFRAGTQQIEELVKKEFPEARVLRMDYDTTRTKESYEQILAAFANGEADILVGTQMIVKGHDFPNVTLVGVLAADMSLYAEDYRAAERTFELLTQAAGRAGRGRKSGDAVIQTYSPEHYSIKSAAMQNYELFYEEEMRFRELMGYPPSEHLLAILLSAEDEELLQRGAYYLKEYVSRIGKKRQIQVIGPASPHVGKVKDVYRRVIYIKEESYQVLIEIKNKMEQYIEINSGFAKIRVQFDFDPMQVF